MTARLDGMPDTREDLLADLAPAGTGIVGNRDLVAVQTVDIARLTTHPVPLVPGSFIVVTGQGQDVDSNGSGKTSFEAAVSLLLADAQWRLEGNGAASAAGLLFKPESAGLDPNHRYQPADHGYVIGVFAASDAPEQTALTVWLRIAVTSPYLKVRWTHGLHIPTGDSDVERYMQADRLWDSLPRVTEIGPMKMAHDLYGEAPRCMAYLETPLRKTPPSLLSQEMSKMDPERIGEALIELSGRSELLETEEAQRSRLAEQKQELTICIADDQRARIDEDADLSAVRHRADARAHLERGEHQWRLHFARGLLDVTARDADLATEIGGLESRVTDAETDRDTAKNHLDTLRAVTDPAQAAQEALQTWQLAQGLLEEKKTQHRDAELRLGQIAERRADLRPLTDGHTGLSVEQATAADLAARQVHDDRRADVLAATRDRHAAATVLDQVSAGRGGLAGQALNALQNADIDAAGLLDAVTLTDEARAVWEPRLWPYRDAVCIGPDDEPLAAAALADAGLAGALLVTGDRTLDGQDTALFDGVSGSVPVAAFLATLAATHDALTTPDRARHSALGQSVLGGFDSHIAGRAARIAAAQTQLDRAERLLTRAQFDEQAAAQAAETAADVLRAAHAVADLAALDIEQQHYQTMITMLAPELNRLGEDEKRTQQAYIDAAATAQSQAEQVDLAVTRLRGFEEVLQRAREAVNGRRLDRAALDISYWAEGWGATVDAARQFLDTQGETSRRLNAATFRNRASDALNDALRAYVGGGNDLPPELEEAQRRREQLRDESGRVGRDTVHFSSIATPLRELLDARLDMDLVLEERITRGQAGRQASIESMRTETDRLDNDLAGLQDAISNRVETALKAIGTALDGLNRGRGGFGAELRIAETRPLSPTAPWKWEVTPRWRRSAASHFVSYKEPANSAQVKKIAIQLVLAALLAHDGAQGRVLILDELGNSLGDVNRKHVLADLHEVAAQQNVTILGTCQDSVLHDAAGVCGQILWFEHRSAADAYNLPTRMWGFDDNGQRVEMQAEWLTAGRGLV
jgi:hypothetical protein